MAENINALMEWTGKTTATVVFDSTVDEFTDNGLFNKVKGKKNIAVIAFTPGGDVFGGFYTVAVTKQEGYFFDRNIFIFSFESHGRCETPQRFAVKESVKDQGIVRFYDGHSYGFVWFGVNGVGGLTIGNERSKSHCFFPSFGFEGMQDTTLTGQDGPNNEHSCTRLIAIQLS